MQGFVKNCYVMLVWVGEFGQPLREAIVMMLVQEDADFVPCR